MYKYLYLYMKLQNKAVSLLHYAHRPTGEKVRGEGREIESCSERIDGGERE